MDATRTARRSDAIAVRGTRLAESGHQCLARRTSTILVRPWDSPGRFPGLARARPPFAAAISSAFCPAAEAASGRSTPLSPTRRAAHTTPRSTRSRSGVSGYDQAVKSRSGACADRADAADSCHGPKRVLVGDGPQPDNPLRSEPDAGPDAKRWTEPDGGWHAISGHSAGSSTEASISMLPISCSTD